VATVVECVGVAGVGKSRLAHLLVEELDALGRPAEKAMAPVGPDTPRSRRLLRKSRFLCAEAVREPRAVCAMVAATLRTGQRHRRDAVAIALNWITLRGLVRRARSRPGVHVFDQAALLGLWSTGHRGDAEPCRRLLEGRAWSWVLPDVVLHVRAPMELTLAQLRGRGGAQSRLEALDDAGLRGALPGAELELDEITRWWRERARPAAGFADVANPGDERLRALASELAAGLGETGASPPEASARDQEAER
jgi:hypothetical protein